jgi:hypothetical protein
MKLVERSIFNAPSWRLATPEVEAWLTKTGGHVGPVTFSLGRRKVRPFHVAPWHGEALPKDTPPIIRVLRGDFFCMPFGGNGTVFGRERHPVHGETANAKWTLSAHGESAGAVRLHATLDTRVRRGRVDKIIELRRGHRAVYQRHVISRMSGPMTFGHHAMLRFPDSGGVVSTSRLTFGSVYPEPTERPEKRGYSILKPAAEFDSLERVPTITGEKADLSRYPARRGFEDIALVASDTSLPFAWTAAVFPEERYVWFALKDPNVLASTMFWFSNGGRHYPPWSGRHVNVLGLEEVTSAFHPGLAESVAPNLLSKRGVKTFVKLDPKRTMTINYIMAVAEIPAGFDRVDDIAADGKGGGVTLVGRSGKKVKAAVDVAWLRGGA